MTASEEEEAEEEEETACPPAQKPSLVGEANDHVSWWSKSRFPHSPRFNILHIVVILRESSPKISEKIQVSLGFQTPGEELFGPLKYT